MTNWPSLALSLYTSLKAYPCRCEYARSNGVALWQGVPLERVLISTCSRCAALEAFEAARA